MGAQLRIFRRRVKSVQATKKITRAMELIAASRIVRAQSRLDAALPYTTELLRAISAAASNTSTLDHPILTTREERRRAAMLLITSDRGLAGAYSSNAIKEAEALTTLLRDEGVEVVPYIVGRKGVGFYRFRGREMARDWTGISEQPTYEAAVEIADALVEAFLLPYDDGGVDEIHVVYTRFVNIGTQHARVRRLLPVEVVEEQREGRAAGQAEASYEFEPSAEEVLDSLLPRYIRTLVYAALLESSASELASRRRAMKAATDNADELMKSLTRQANQARQAEITQEISEIVGGANALADASAGSE